MTFFLLLYLNQATQVLYVSTQNFVSVSSSLGGCGVKAKEVPSKYIRCNMKYYYYYFYYYRCVEHFELFSCDLFHLALHIFKPIFTIVLHKLFFNNDLILNLKILKQV